MVWEKRLGRRLEKLYETAKAEGHLTTESCLISREGPIAEETTRLMSSHYDECLELFNNFLDTKYMGYSMAYFGATPQEVGQNSCSLEEAQAAKFDLFCQRAGLSGNERILNIGCGFGSLEKYLLDRYPEISVVGLTPSRIQCDYLNGLIQDKSSLLGCGRFELIEGTLDDVELEKESFDLVFSVGVLEHIKNLRDALRKMSLVLKPRGKAFHHLITSRVAVPAFLDAKRTRIDEYFPGGRIWPFEELARQTEHLELENSWYLNGMNYWRTVEEWHKRFWANIDQIRSIHDEDAIRHWNDYFSLCKIVFSPMNGEMVGNGQYLFSKPS